MQDRFIERANGADADLALKISSKISGIAILFLELISDNLRRRRSATECIMPINKPQRRDFSWLKAEVRNNDGVLTVSMELLLGLIEYQRAGSTAREYLRSRLAEHRLAHIPADLPATKYESVRLFDMESPAGELFEAVFEVGEKADAKLRDFVDADCRETLHRIRQVLDSAA